MFTLEGRIHVQAGVPSGDEQRYRQEKIKEIVLLRDDIGFYLVFCFSESEVAHSARSEMPQYVTIPEQSASTA